LSLAEAEVVPIWAVVAVLEDFYLEQQQFLLKHTRLQLDQVEQDLLEGQADQEVVLEQIQ
jgi:hypothetical protein